MKIFFNTLKKSRNRESINLQLSPYSNPLLLHEKDGDRSTQDEKRSGNGSEREGEV